MVQQVIASKPNEGNYRILFVLDLVGSVRRSCVLRFLWSYLVKFQTINFTEARKIQ